MASEQIPSAFMGRFEAPARPDAAVVSMYVAGRLLGNKGVQYELERVARTDRLINAALAERLNRLGHFLEPVDDDLEILDENCVRLGTYNAGVALATRTIDSYALESNHNPRDWREHWLRMPAMFEVPGGYDEERPLDTEACAEVGMRLVAGGAKYFDELEEEYRNLFESIDEAFPSGVVYNNIFRSSFALVFHIGRTLVDEQSRIEAASRAADEIIENTGNLNKAFFNYLETNPFDDAAPSGAIDRNKERCVTEAFRGDDILSFIREAEHSLSYSALTDEENAELIESYKAGLVDMVHEMMDSTMLRLFSTIGGMKVAGIQSKAEGQLAAYDGVEFVRDEKNDYQIYHVFTVVDEGLESADVAYILPEDIKHVSSLAGTIVPYSSGV